MKRGYQRRTKSKRSKSKRPKSNTKRSKRLRSLNKKGGAPPSYVGSIQGEFINDRGQQLFRNPVGGIA
jgi:hypothetical protein